MTATPSPGVTTPPTDEQRAVGVRIIQSIAWDTDRPAAADAIAQALADQAAAIHARYEAACVEAEEMAQKVIDAMPEDVERGSDEAWQMASEFSICVGIRGTVDRVREVSR